MNKRKVKKEALIHEAAVLFTSRGYHNTSIADIAERCQLKKASIYNYIISKEQLAHDTLEQVHQTVEQQIFQISVNGSQAISDRLMNTAQAIEAFFIENQAATLFIKMSLDLANIPAFMHKIQNHYDGWLNLFSNLLEQLGHSLEQAQALAKQSLAELQGAVLMANIYQTPQPIKAFCRKLYSSFQPVRNITSA